jgi:hypothetical protein
VGKAAWKHADNIAVVVLQTVLKQCSHYMVSHVMTPGSTGAQHQYTNVHVFDDMLSVRGGRLCMHVLSGAAVDTTPGSTGAQSCLEVQQNMQKTQLLCCSY